MCCFTRFLFVVIMTYLLHFRSPIFSSFTETLDGFRSIRFCGLEDVLLNRTRYFIDKHIGSFLLFRSLFQWAGLRLDLAAMAITAVVSISCVVFQDTLSPAMAGRYRCGLQVRDEYKHLVPSVLSRHGSCGTCRNAIRPKFTVCPGVQCQDFDCLCPLC